MLNRKFSEISSEFQPEAWDPEKDPIINRIIDVLDQLDVNRVKGVYFLCIGALEESKSEAVNRNLVYRRAEE